MFFVFGPSGQMYRGGPENLAQIAPVRRVQRPQALRTRAMDEPPADTVPAFAPATAAPTPGVVVNLRLQDAVSAYAQTGQGPQPQRQPLTKVRDVMTSGGLSVQPGVRVNDAWQTLAEHKVAQAPVVDPLGRVIGVPETTTVPARPW